MRLHLRRYFKKKASRFKPWRWFDSKLLVRPDIVAASKKLAESVGPIRKDFWTVGKEKI